MLGSSLGFNELSFFMLLCVLDFRVSIRWPIWLGFKLPGQDHSPEYRLALVLSLIIRSGVPGGSDGKESACSEGDPGSIPGSGRCPGEGSGDPLQCSCLEKPMDRGAWWATVLGVTKSWMCLSDWHFHFHTIIGIQEERKGRCLVLCAFDSSVQSLSRVWLWPCGLKHSRPPCPSSTLGVYSDSCLLSQWCHPNISSSVVPFSCLQSFPASGSFPMSQLFTSGGQSIGVSASTSVLPMNIQDLDNVNPILGSSVVCFELGLFMCDVEGSFLLLLTCSGSCVTHRSCEGGIPQMSSSYVSRYPLLTKTLQDFGRKWVYTLEQETHTHSLIQVFVLILIIWNRFERKNVDYS